MKSASANVGAMGVSINAREHERAVDRGDHAFVDEHVGQLLSEYEAQIAHISNYLADSQKSRNGINKVRKISQEELTQQIRQALDCLENFHAKECAHKIGELMQCQLQSDVEAQLTEVQGLLKLYEDEKAEQMLREMLGHFSGN